jgi:hypothetical protein
MPDCKHEQLHIDSRDVKGANFQTSAYVCDDCGTTIHIGELAHIERRFEEVLERIDRLDRKIEAMDQSLGRPGSPFGKTPLLSSSRRSNI